MQGKLLNAVAETNRRRENWKKGLPVMDLEAYEFDRLHCAESRKRDFYYDKFGTKFTKTKYCTSEDMPNKEELQMDNFKLQEDNKKLKIKIDKLQEQIKKWTTLNYRKKDSPPTK